MLIITFSEFAGFTLSSLHGAAREGAELWQERRCHRLAVSYERPAAGGRRRVAPRTRAEDRASLNDKHTHTHTHTRHLTTHQHHLLHILAGGSVWPMSSRVLPRTTLTTYHTLLCTAVLPQLTCLAPRFFVYSKGCCLRNRLTEIR